MPGPWLSFLSFSVIALHIVMVEDMSIGCPLYRLGGSMKGRPLRIIGYPATNENAKMQATDKPEGAFIHTEICA